MVGVTSEQETPFFHDVEPAQRYETDLIDVYTAPGSENERRPALVFVHGGPVAPGASPRAWSGFVGYGSLAAASGLVGVTLDHRLHSGDHYPTAADDVAAAVEQTRGLDAVDPDRVGIWFFSGGGPLAVDWMHAAPSWLRCLAWNYPVLAPPPDWDGDVPRFNAITALAASPALPKLLLRAGQEYPALVPDQDTFTQEARDHGAALEVVDIPGAEHGFEGHGRCADARAAVQRAMSWAASMLRTP